jgi:CrcB protein
MNVAELTNCLLVFAGGGLGAVCRYGVQHLHIFAINKYHATMTANLTGCFIIGVLWALLSHWQTDRVWYLFLVTGILGGYTTFSSFSLDAITMFQSGYSLRALLYVLMSVIGGLVFCAIGIALTQRMFKL